MCFLLSQYRSSDFNIKHLHICEIYNTKKLMIACIWLIPQAVSDRELFEFNHMNRIDFLIFAYFTSFICILFYFLKYLAMHHDEP